MITITLTPEQICSYYVTASKNFAEAQPERFWCYSKNAEKCDKWDLDNDPDFTDDKSSLYWFDNKLQADIFYNFICEHTDNEAYCCSDESDFEECYVVCVNINMIDSDKPTSELITMKMEKVC
tara:strand:+ start:1866 stop:2234 length:369 start_codon:yes stop_codon:yes gene_type:complete